MNHQYQEHFNNFLEIGNEKLVNCEGCLDENARCHQGTVSQCKNIDTTLCYAFYDENGNQNSCIGYGTGFGWAPDPRPEFIFPSKNILYENCCANNCQVGFDSWYHIDSVWKKICACCCGISVLNLNNSQRTISCNACSECNPPIVITLTNVAKGNKFINVKATYC